MRREQWLLITGDVVLLLILAVIGFLSHGRSPLTPRLFTTFGAFLLAWLWVAVPLGLFHVSPSGDPVRLAGRVVWAWSLAAPLGALIRAWWLGRTAPFAFVLVTFGLYALSFALWRTLINHRIRRSTQWHPAPR